MNVSGCVRLHGQSTSTYLAIANRDDQTVLAINDTHLLDQLTPQLLNGSRDLLRHAGVVLADCNLTAEALEWVFTLADEIRCLSIPFQNSKRAKSNTGWRIFTP